MHLLERSQRISADPAQVFDFFADPRNLEEITPPWLHFRITRAPYRVDAGAEPDGEGVLVRDRVHYSLPCGALGEFMHRLLVHHDLERIFDYRREEIERRFRAAAPAGTAP